MAITINGSGITSANIADGTITASDISASEVKNLKSGRKNLIINGGFDVWQRGTSFTPAPAYNYSADRARLSSGSVVNITKESATLDGNTVNTIKHSIISPSVDAAVRYDQRIEEFDYFKNKTFTLSFWVKASRTHALDSSYIFFGGGGVNTHAFSLGNATTTWTKKTVTFTVGDLSTATGTYGDMVLGIKSDGSSIDIEYAQVQLEVGSVATDFEHRSYGEELALCQRYYQLLGGVPYAAIGFGKIYATGQTAMAFVPFTAEMRAPPSVAEKGNGLIVTDRVSFDSSVTSISSANISTNCLYARFNTGTTHTNRHPVIIACKNGTLGWLELSAEL